jgi:uncharacterized repeat protein (TIGR03806 family)
MAFASWSSAWSLGGLAVLVVAAAAACGDDDPAGGAGPGASSNGGSSSSSGGTTSSGSSGDPNADGGEDFTPIPDGPDVPPKPFPLATPPLFGYALVDAFPNTCLSGAMDMEWPAGSTKPFVLQRGGAIVRLNGDGTRVLVLDFESVVAARAEAGALSMALHPKFADATAPQPYVYIWYNAEGAPTHQRLSRFTFNAATGLFDRASELIMVDQTESKPEHNGARIRFGPDGFLYFGNGDDTRNNETPQTLVGGLFSGVFRIDVDSRGGAVSHPPPKQPLNAVTQGYFIPNNNPFVGTANAAEEYFALGFRNPYGFTFDRATGKMWLGDVGDTWREEIDEVVAGNNYGWPIYEGNVKRRDGEPVIGAYKKPLYEYSHASLGDLSAIGAGHVYRGPTLPELAGKLVFSDWPTGRIWALDLATGKRSSLVESNSSAPVGFGQDAAGEVYIIGWDKILKLTRAPAPHGVPLKLSQTGIFRSPTTMNLPSSVIPYSIKSPLWSDGASKARFVYIPAGKTASVNAKGDVALPAGSLLIKQFDLPETAKPVNDRTRKLETRVLVVGENNAVYGLTYRFNRKGTDADLVLEGVQEQIDDSANPAESRLWHFPSMGECWSCHRAENRVLAFRGEQMNFAPGAPLAAGENQLAAFAAKGIFDQASIASAPAAIASPTDTTASAEARATAYLAANCAPCHHPGASFLGGGDTWNAMPGVATAARGLVNVQHHNAPMATKLGLPGAPLIAPGNPAGSILRQRLNATDEDVRMPPLLRSKVDPVAISVIDQWIMSMAQ